MKSLKVFVAFLGIAFYYKILKYAFFFSFPMLESLETLSPILLVSFLLQSDICIERVGVIRVKTWINF